MEAKLKNDHGKLYLTTTSNGYQWCSIRIDNPDEDIPLLISVLESYRQQQDSADHECPECRTWWAFGGECELCHRPNPNR